MRGSGLTTALHGHSRQMRQCQTLRFRCAAERNVVPLNVPKLLEVPCGPKLAEPGITAALVVDGAATVAGEKLGVWDFVYVHKGERHDPILFPDGATLLCVTMR